MRRVPKEFLKIEPHPIYRRLRNEGHSAGKAAIGRQSGNEVTSNMRLNRKFVILAVPAILALAGGALAVHAASTPTPAPAKSQAQQPAESQTEESGTSATETEKADAPGDVQSGHADTGDQADHQFEGNE
jgi:hypothetical protein